MCELHSSLLERRGGGWEGCGGLRVGFVEGEGPWGRRRETTVAVARERGVVAILHGSNGGFDHGALPPLEISPERLELLSRESRDFCFLNLTPPPLFKYS